MVFLVVALFGIAGIGYRFVQRETQDTVNAAQLSSSSSALSRLGSHQSISIRLSEAETQLEELETLFPLKLGGPSTVSRLIRMAERSNLSVSDVQTQPGTDEEINDHTYHRLSIEMHFEGTLSSLMLFLEELEDGAVPASRIDHLIINNVTPSVGPDGLPQYTMDISLLISLFSRDPLPAELEPEPAAGEPAPTGGS